MRIPDWNQHVISQQTCLLLGLGGLGSTVSIDLVRLGVKRIICVDYDVVETHNLNRQSLYNQSHVGQPKADCARQVLQQHHNICYRGDGGSNDVNGNGSADRNENSKVDDTNEKNDKNDKNEVGNNNTKCSSSSSSNSRMQTQIECYNMDAVKNWDRIVEFARESTVVFNMIDVGDHWDYAVQALCLRFGLTFVSGGTFQTTVTVDYVHAQSRGACWSCMSDLKSEHLSRMGVDQIEHLKNLEFIPMDEHPIGASTCYLAAICAHLMVNRWIYGLQLSSSSCAHSSSLSDGADEDNERTRQQHLLDSLPNRIMFYLNTLEVDKWTLERSTDCPLCSSIHSS